MSRATLRTLRKRAEARCKLYGHDMRWSQIGEGSAAYGFCCKCFGSVALRSYAATGGEMSGRPLEVRCSKAQYD